MIYLESFVLWHVNRWNCTLCTSNIRFQHFFRYICGICQNSNIQQLEWVAIKNGWRTLCGRNRLQICELLKNRFGLENWLDTNEFDYQKYRWRTNFQDNNSHKVTFSIKTWYKQQPLSRSFRNFCLHHQKNTNVCCWRSFVVLSGPFIGQALCLHIFFDVMLLNIGKTAEIYSVWNSGPFPVLLEKFAVVKTPQGCWRWNLNKKVSGDWKFAPQLVLINQKLKWLHETLWCKVSSSELIKWLLFKQSQEEIEFERLTIACYDLMRYNYIHEIDFHALPFEKNCNAINQLYS